MNFKQKFALTVAAGAGGIWITSPEHLDALETIKATCTERNWLLSYWQPMSRLDNISRNAAHSNIDAAAALDYLATEQIKGRTTDKANQPQRAVLVLDNFTRYLCDAAGSIVTPAQNHLLQKLQDLIVRGEEERLHVVILAYDNLTPPPELIRMLRLLDHSLPDLDELRTLLSKVVPDEMPIRESPEETAILGAAQGLSRLEAVNAFSECLTEHNRLDVTAIWKLKAAAMEKDGILTLLDARDDTASEMPPSFDNLGGMEALKADQLQIFASGNRSAVVRPKGILLLGPPGTGKSKLCRAIGKAVRRAVLRFDVGAVRGKYVGESEARLRATFNRLLFCGPVVVMFDELEKALGGGDEDGGVGARLMGSLLTFFAEAPPNIYIVATCNDISRLPPELTRAGRFDGVWYIDLPGREQKDQIWDIQIKFYAQHGLTLELTTQRPDDTDWTGAEIESCCVRAALRGLTLVEAAEFVVPVYKTNREKIDYLRQWASGRCLSADYGGVYDASANHSLLKPGDRLSRGRRQVDRAAVAPPARKKTP